MKNQADIATLTRINLMVREQETGQQFRFGMPGPALKPEEWQELLNLLSHLDPFPGFLVVSGSLPPGMPAEFCREVAQLVKRHQSRLVFDSSSDGLRQALDQGVFLVKPNLRELGQAVGKEKLGEDEEILNAARQLVEQGRSEVVVVSLGRGGAVLVSRDNCVWVRAPSVNIQSKVGAGDSMVAGITLTLARGGSEVDAVCYGVAAGAAAVMTPGSELCRREDAERLNEQVKRAYVEHCKKRG
jgi:6-phosphofructokinase 2